VSTDYSDAPEAAVIADLAEQANDILAAELELTGDVQPAGLLNRRRRSDESIDLRDLEGLLPAPRELRGTAVVRSPLAFAALVERYADAATTVWADVAARGGRGEVTAIFNDHTEQRPGWRDHRTVYCPELDEDFKAWRDQSAGPLLPKEAFLDFLQDHLANIISPAPAELVEIAAKLRALKTAEFDQEVDVKTGGVEFTYKVKRSASVSGGKLSYPGEVVISTFVYAGAADAVQRVQIEGRLAWDVNDRNQLVLGVRLHRLAEKIREAWEAETAKLRDALPAGVLLVDGPAPAALRELAVRRPATRGDA
jgi:uncharacterized protein YfdQ (DUF2303 family)